MLVVSYSAEAHTLPDIPTVPIAHLLGNGGQNVRVSGIGDVEHGHSEEAAARGAEVDVGSRVVVDVGLGQHCVVFNLGLLQSLERMVNTRGENDVCERAWKRKKKPQ